MVDQQMPRFCRDALDHETCAAAVGAIDKYTAFVRDNLANREEMPIAIGEDAFKKLVEWAEVVDIDLERCAARERRTSSARRRDW